MDQLIQLFYIQKAKLIRLFIQNKIHFPYYIKAVPIRITSLYEQKTLKPYIHWKLLNKFIIHKKETAFYSMKDFQIYFQYYVNQLIP